jgi:integrase
VLTRRARGLHDEGFLFGNGKTRPENAEQIRADLGAAGLPTTQKGASVVFHSLRHTFSTLLSDAGVSTDLIDRMLGQAPASTRARHYSKPSIEAMARAVESIVLEPAADPPLSQGVVPEALSQPPYDAKTLAPPARVELAANGLGNRCSIP